MEVSKQYLKDLGAFTTEVPYIVDIMTKSIPAEVPKNLALTIVLSEISAFLCSFRNNILMNTPSKKLSTKVPTNTYIFSLSPSGISKDRTKNTIHKLLEGGYKELDKRIKADLKSNAKAMAIAEGDEEANYYQYMEAPIDPEFKFGTTAGVASEISDIGNKQRLGSPTLLSSEIGSDLATRGEELIKTFTILSDLYDMGTGKFDTVKSMESKLAPVKGLPVNFLVFGSEKGILMDSGNKKKFKQFFNQQLARRCMFSYTSKVTKVPLPKTIKERKERREAIAVVTGKYYDTIFTVFEELGVWMPNNTDILTSTEVDDAFAEYLNYNDQMSETMSDTLPISKLARKHKQWLALKLSGLYALIDKSSSIQVPHYIDAINTVEILAPDLEAFEAELDKEPYEILDAYCLANNTESKEYSISLHELKKMNFIEGRSGAEAKLRELVMLLNDYSQEGIYSIEGSTLRFEKAVVTETVGASILAINTDEIEEAIANKSSKAIIQKLKQKLSWETVYGYNFLETDSDGDPLTFKDYAELLVEDLAYTPFKLLDASEATYDKAKHPDAEGGVRGKENIASGAKFVVLDVDTSTITDEEAHLLLEGINHHIARTSDPDNRFKFRILVELDIIVKLDSIVWKFFIKSVGERLGINIDPVAQSQIFYAYKGRDVLSEVDGSPLEVKDLVVQALEAKEIKVSAAKALGKPQMKTMLENPMSTFEYAFNTSTGARSVTMMRAAYHARDFGADTEYILNLIDQINRYIDEPLTPEYLDKCIYSQIERW